MAKRASRSRTCETKSPIQLATPGTWEFSAVALLLFRNPALILHKLLISALRGEKPLDYVQYAPNNAEHSRKPQFVHWRNAILTLQLYISLKLQYACLESNQNLPRIDEWGCSTVELQASNSIHIVIVSNYESHCIVLIRFAKNEFSAMAWTLLVSRFYNRYPTRN